MQIFCPFPSHLAANPKEIETYLEVSFGLLDSRRLRNQVFRESKTILGGGWKNHPAARFPKSFICWHAHLCLLELDRREAIQITDLLWWQSEYPSPEFAQVEFPKNLEAIAESHRISLTRKLWIESVEDKSMKQREEAKMRIAQYATPKEQERIFTPTHYVWP